MSAANIFAAQGRTGLMLVEPANEESVTWESTISEASTVKDSEERGSENPFTVSYRKALEGASSPYLSDTDFDPTLWWLTRVCAFLLGCALVTLFRTDAFSSALLTRRALRGYIVDSTQTKLPLSSFCSSAKCEKSLEDRFIVVTLEPFKAGRVSLPKHRLIVASALDVLLVLLWISILAITPWFHLVGSSYLSGVPIWATVLSCLVVLVASHQHLLLANEPLLDTSQVGSHNDRLCRHRHLFACTFRSFLGRRCGRALGCNFHESSHHGSGDPSMGSWGSALAHRHKLHGES